MKYTVNIYSILGMLFYATENGILSCFDAKDVLIKNAVFLLPAKW